MSMMMTRRAIIMWIVLHSYSYIRSMSARERDPQSDRDYGADLDSTDAYIRCLHRMQYEGNLLPTQGPSAQQLQRLGVSALSIVHSFTDRTAIVVRAEELWAGSTFGTISSSHIRPRRNIPARRTEIGLMTKPSYSKYTCLCMLWICSAMSHLRYG
ncbi:hypothetical protein BDV97DRAFT_198875 [Delphinella strobiligena]|nr:hypothetical protein BDV97DRAFT_198875 [Delphinella strobiligena]